MLAVARTRRLWPRMLATLLLGGTRASASLRSLRSPTGSRLVRPYRPRLPANARSSAFRNGLQTVRELELLLLRIAGKLWDFGLPLLFLDSFRCVSHFPSQNITLGLVYSCVPMFDASCSGRQCGKCQVGVLEPRGRSKTLCSAGTACVRSTRDKFVFL